MKKLKDITDFLLQLNLFASEQLESWAEDAELVYDGSTVSGNDGGIVLYRQEYTAQIVIERFDHQQFAAELLFAHVVAWLIDHDPYPHNEDRKPEFDIDILDNRKADITISIEFDEKVEILPDVDGPIVLQDQSWKLAPSVIDYAEEGDVTT
jgi:hypothetical protein